MGSTSALLVIREQSTSAPYLSLFALPITESEGVLGSRKRASRLTDILARHRVSAILLRLRPVTALRRRFVRLSHWSEHGKQPRNLLALHRNEDDSESADQDYIFLLYIVAYLDRINIGFAALTMNKELGITSQQFGLLFGIFFFGYFLFEIPSNLLLHKIGARVWIARILISWGIVAMLTGFAQNVSQLYVARFLLGLAEAGFAPGMLLYLTYWFRQREQAHAVGLYLSGMPIASILGAPLSGFVLDRVHWLSLGSWRWLLILEGIPAVVFGVLTYFLLPNRPQEAQFLTTEEKEWIREELAREEQQKLKQRQFSALQALTNGRVWHLVAIYFGMLTGLYSLNSWGPQLVKSLSDRYSNSSVGFLVMFPSFVGLAAMILISRNSDRTLERRYHVAIPALAGGAALMLLGAVHSVFLAVVLLSFVALGVYGFMGPFWALPSEFLSGFSAAAGLALINSTGNLAGFTGPYIIGAIATRTGNLYAGLALAGVFMFAAAILVLLIPKSADSPRSLTAISG